MGMYKHSDHNSLIFVQFCSRYLKIFFLQDKRQKNLFKLEIVHLSFFLYPQNKQIKTVAPIIPQTLWPIVTFSNKNRLLLPVAYRPPLFLSKRLFCLLLFPIANSGEGAVEPENAHPPLRQTMNTIGSSPRLAGSNIVTNNPITSLRKTSNYIYRFLVGPTVKKSNNIKIKVICGCSPLPSQV